MTSSHIFQVSELTRAVKEVVEAEFPFVLVRGQVFNLSRPASGHIYFTLRDEEASLNVVWFKNAQQGKRSADGDVYDPVTGEVLDEAPGGAGLEDGAEALCAGRMAVYPPRGTYQLVAEMVQDMGEGRLHLEFEALKRELAEKGYFDPDRKTALPRHPVRVAVITAPTGAAIRDFVRIGRTRGYGCELRLYPTLVQGEAAPGQIAAALDRAGDDGWAEVAVLIRGGGSMEDLWAFNTRETAEALHRSRIPVVCGVGHEVDVSIADMVADVRAATPSHAAQLLWPERETLMQRVDDLETAAVAAMDRLVSDKERELEGVARGLSWLSPAERLGRLEDRFRSLDGRLRSAATHSLQRRMDGAARLSERLAAAFGPGRLERLETRRADLVRRLKSAGALFPAGLERGLERAAVKLESLDPAAPLARGYSLVRLEDGRLLRSAAEADIGDTLDILLSKGRVQAEVTQTQKNTSTPNEQPS